MKFQKGQSGNPGGRPKGVKEVEDLAREHSAGAIKTLAAIHADRKAPHAARVAAANALLDRAWGRPRQNTEISGPDGGPVIINYTKADEALL